MALLLYRSKHFRPLFMPKAETGIRWLGKEE